MKPVKAAIALPMRYTLPNITVQITEFNPTIVEKLSVFILMLPILKGGTTMPKYMNSKIILVRSPEDFMVANKLTQSLTSGLNHVSFNHISKRILVSIVPENDGGH